MEDTTSTQAQIEAELRHIIGILIDLSGLPSRWSGQVELVPDAGFNGKKRFTCDIQLDAELTGQEARWATLIHEALHTVSAGYIGTDYRDFPGWEEGVVEQLQRLHRSTILARLGISVSDEVFRAAEAKHNYNKYIQSLEQVRLTLHSPVDDFYMTLIKTPIKHRFSYVYGLGRGLTGSRRIRFIAALSAANSVLKDFA